jgi:ATP-dependent helicase HrpB
VSERNTWPKPTGLEPLPIDAVLADVTGALSRAPNLVLRAPTGAGKTTRVAPALIDANAIQGVVLLLEPRRMAARAAARRIAAEREVTLGGDEVGYIVRFDRKATARTRVIAMTYGIFLRRMQEDPFLEGIGAVLFDEIHERSLDADLALAMARRIQRDVKPELRLVAMSATLDAEPLARFLGDATFVTSEGRSHPVAVRHLATPAEREMDRAVTAAVATALAESTGDVLVFLPGVGEIRGAAAALKALAERERLLVMELYGDLPPEQQDAVLKRADRRKIVLSTNVAESSVTIDGITAVIDTGLARVLRFDSNVGLDRLEISRISRTSADQRAGRAGRTAPGLCLRLWSEHDDRALRPSEEPEVARVDLSRAVLELRAFGEPDAKLFAWFEAPPLAAIEAAEGLLRDLGAIDEQGLTSTGRLLSGLPLPPRIGRLLVEAARLGCLDRAALAAAILTERDPLRRGRDAPKLRATTMYESDLLERVLLLERFAEAPSRGGQARPDLALLNVGAAQAVLRVARELRTMLREVQSVSNPASGAPDESFLRALLAAFPDRVARRRERGSDRAVMVGGRGLRVGTESVVHTAELFVCVDVEAGRRGERAESLVRQASGVEEAWLSPSMLRTVSDVVFDETLERVTGTARRMYRDLVLTEKSVTPSLEVASTLLAERAAAAPSRALDLEDEDVRGFLARVGSLALWMPELALPAFDETTLATVAREIAAGRRSFEEMRRVPLREHLEARLSYQQKRALREQAPESLGVPSGNDIRLRYELGRPPVLAVRIQELFGMRDSPRVAGGRIAVVVHLLAPNGRPQQVTDDLASFWRNTYAEIRKELRARYPRHSWPDDPLTAPPQRRPGRRV